MNEPYKRIKLKCRFDGDIRTVAVTPETEFVELRKRLSTDYGFEVSLKYEDKDGDLIILSSQNDLDDLFIFGECETVNVTVSETISLPSIQKTVKSSAAVSTSMQASRDWTKHSGQSNLLRPIATTSRNDRFPVIGDHSMPRHEESHNIRWKRAEMLGQGAFGVVFLGLNIETGELMAVKQMATEEVSRRELSSLENEINLLRTLRHPNIVRYIGTELTGTSLSIFLEYVPGGSLKALIDKFGHLEESVAKSYTRQLLIGLEYLHRNGIAHRDIKGANCLVGNDGVIKLADFGNSKHWRATGTSSAAVGEGSALQQQPTGTGEIKGTPSWMAPEVVRDSGAVSWKKADVWSLACTTLEMTTGKPPWSQFNNPVTVLYHIACQDTLPEYPHPASVELITFLNACLQRDPLVRPDITSMLLHPFVTSNILPSGGLPGGWGHSQQQGGGNLYSNRPSTVSTAFISSEWDSSFASGNHRQFSSNAFHSGTSTAQSTARLGDEPRPVIGSTIHTVHSSSLSGNSAAVLSTPRGMGQLTPRHRQSSSDKSPLTARLDAPSALVASRGDLSARHHVQQPPGIDNYQQYSEHNSSGLTPRMLGSTQSSGNRGGASASGAQAHTPLLDSVNQPELAHEAPYFHMPASSRSHTRTNSAVTNIGGDDFPSGNALQAAYVSNVARKTNVVMPPIQHVPRSGKGKERGTPKKSPSKKLRKKQQTTTSGPTADYTSATALSDEDASVTSATTTATARRLKAASTPLRQTPEPKEEVKEVKRSPNSSSGVAIPMLDINKSVNANLALNMLQRHQRQHEAKASSASSGYESDDNRSVATGGHCGASEYCADDETMSADGAAMETGYSTDDYPSSARLRRHDRSYEGVSPLDSVATSPSNFSATKSHSAATAAAAYSSIFTSILEEDEGRAAPDSQELLSRKGSQSAMTGPGLWIQSDAKDAVRTDSSTLGDKTSATSESNVVSVPSLQCNLTTAADTKFAPSELSKSLSQVSLMQSAKATTRNQSTLNRSVDLSGTSLAPRSAAPSRQSAHAKEPLRISTDRDCALFDALDISCDSLDQLQVNGVATGAGVTAHSSGKEQRLTERGEGAKTLSTASRRTKRASTADYQSYVSLDEEVAQDTRKPLDKGESVPVLSEPLVLEEHTSAVTRLRAPQKTNLLVSASTDGTIRIWGGGEVRSRAVLDASSFSQALSKQTAEGPLGQFGEKVERKVALGTAADAAEQTSLASARTVKILNAWVEDSCETVWGACSDGALRVWSGAEGRPSRLLKGHEDSVSAMEGMDASGGVQQSSSLVSTGSVDRTVRIWDVRLKKAQVFLFRGHGDTVLTLRWGEGGRSLISGSKDKTVRIWDTRAGRLRITLEKHFGAVNSLRVLSGASPNPAGVSFLSAGRDAMLNAWTANGDCISSQSAHRGAVTFLSEIWHRPHSAPLMASLGVDNLVKVWDLKRLRSVAEISPPSSLGNVTKTVWCGPSLVVSGSTGLIRMYDPHSATGAAPDQATTTDGFPQSSSVGGKDRAAAEWTTGRDLPSHSQASSDLVSTDCLLASASRSGQILRWDVNHS